MNITTNRELAIEIFQTLMDNYDYIKSFSKGGDAPQFRFLPEQIVNNWGSLKHRRYLFFLCLFMRAKIKSVTAFEGVRKMYEAHHHLFDPDSARFADHEMVMAWLKEAGLGILSKDNARAWIHNSDALIKHFDGDPINIFTNRHSHREVWPLMRKHFKGFGGHGKVVSLFILFIQELGLIPNFTIPEPIDVHWLRICLLTEIAIVDQKDFDRSLFDRSHLIETLKTLTHEICETEGFDHILLCNALWLLGSNLCARHPQNTADKNGIPIDKVPIKDWCEERCPICQYCKFTMPSVAYYTRGKIPFRLTPRKKNPQQLLFTKF